MGKFYRAWELDALAPNEVHAVLHILTFYDPYTTVHDVTADPDDPNAEGAEITRALDDFGVYPGVCLYCKGQRFRDSREHIPAEYDIGVFRRVILQHLAHHAKVQADALSPCDLRDFTEEELVALGYITGVAPGRHHRVWTYEILSYNFTASVRLTRELLGLGIDVGRDLDGSGRTARVLVRPGEVLSPFTHAMRAAGGPPNERGLEACLEAVKGIVEWDRKRYSHFLGRGETLIPYLENIFPPRGTSEGETSPPTYTSQDILPTWAWFLVDESGGQDKNRRLMNQFRALNLPAIKEGSPRIPATWGVIYFDETAAKKSATREGHWGVLLSPYDLYLHRNIGYGGDEEHLDIDDLIRDEPFPARCRIERRRSEGTKESRPRPNSPHHSYEFWVRGPSSEVWERISFHAERLSDRYIDTTEPILVYVCD